MIHVFIERFLGGAAFALCVTGAFSIRSTVLDVCTTGFMIGGAMNSLAVHEIFWSQTYYAIPSNSPAEIIVGMFKTYKF